MNRATAIPGLNREDAYRVSISLPPLKEQKRIVEKIEDLRARTTRARTSLAIIPALVEKYKSAMFKLAFSGSLTADFSKNINTNHGMPDSWNIRLLGEIAEIQSGIQVGKKRKSQVDLIEVPYLRVANVQRGWLDLNEVKTIGVTHEEKNRLLLKNGDILMNEGGDRDKLGRGWVWEGQLEECIHQNHVFRIRLSEDGILPEFISYYANELGQQYFIDQGTQTTNLASISKRRVAALPVPVPSFEEAIEIVRRIKSTFAWLDRITVEHSTASELLFKLDAAILSKAFHGKLVPQDSNDEPASALLERVAKLHSRQPQKRKEQITRLKTIKGASVNVVKNIEQVLNEVKNWIPAQTAFQHCGIGDNALVEDIERLYAQLRELDIAGKLEVKTVTDDQGRKVNDLIRLRVA